MNDATNESDESTTTHDASDGKSSQVVFTVTEVAKRWRCARRSVMDLIAKGGIIAFKIGVRTHRIALAEVLRVELERAKVA